MAGTAILENLKQTANLNITEHSITANRRCLCLVQPQVVEQNNGNAKHRPMKAHLTNYCHNSSCNQNRILTNNYNITTQQQKRQKCPLTLGLLIIMSLAIVLTQMPTMVIGKPISSATSLELTLAADAASSSSSSEASAESDLLVLSSEEEMEEEIKQNVDISSDSLSSLEVLRYIQLNQQQQQEGRKRHRKRHINDLVIKNYLHENSNNLEWRNPCNGVFKMNSFENNHIPKHEYLKNFRKTVRNEHLTKDLSANAINIADINDWSMYVGTYSFLPKLNRNGNITLSRWYRNMQTYVASFGYLARTQYNFDQKKQIFTGDTSEELNKLLISARHLLCELETTINGSFPINNLKKLKTISRQAMNEKLDGFQTKRDVLRYHFVEPNTVDLKFAKYSYLKFVSNMHTILNRKLKRKNKSRKQQSSDENQSSFSIMIDDDNSSFNKNSNTKTDSSLSLLDSFEEFVKSQRKH